MGLVWNGRGTQARMMIMPRAPRIPSSLPISAGRTFALRRGRAQWSSVFVGLFVLLALPAVLPPFWIHLANGCLIAVIGAVALNLLTGNARLVSLGQAAFLGTGAFAAGPVERTCSPHPISPHRCRSPAPRLRAALSVALLHCYPCACGRFMLR